MNATYISSYKFVNLYAYYLVGLKINNKFQPSS
jgi:hypothetical protein